MCGISQLGLNKNELGVLQKNGSFKPPLLRNSSCVTPITSLRPSASGLSAGPLSKARDWSFTGLLSPLGVKLSQEA